MMTRKMVKVTNKKHYPFLDAKISKSSLVFEESRKGVHIFEMGVSYYKCENCEECVYEEYISPVEVEGYDSLELCQWCRDDNMIGKPSEFVEIDEFEFVAKQGDDVKEFKDIYDLQEFIFGVPEDNIESHLDWQFGINGLELMSANNKEEAETMFQTLLDSCRLKSWEKLERKDEENTDFYPKREWLETQLVTVTGEIENLQRKKRRLEELLTEPK